MKAIAELAATTNQETQYSSAALDAQKARNQSSLGLTVSICGSYRKHLKEMKHLIVECRKLGIEVIIPKYATKKYSKQGFVYLRGEIGTPKELQQKNFAAIARSSFLLIVDPKGYIGPSTSMEIGYAIARGIPIFCTERPKDYVFRLYTDYRKSLREIRDSMFAK